MKKFGYYSILMILVIIVLPLLIVKGCGVETKEIVPKEQQSVVNKNIKIKVYITSDKVIKVLDLEEYVKGVVAAEMPADFEPEALKAQAVAARTYAYARMKNLYISKTNPHIDASVCTDPGHCQAWISKKAAMKKWGIFKAGSNWRKIEKAVDDTRGIIIMYQGTVINPLFHSNSGGRTENSEDVWEGVSVPYLKSVISEGEEASNEYRNVVTMRMDDFYSTLKAKYPDISLNKRNIPQNVHIMSYTLGGRVKAIKIGNLIFKGTEIRSLFSLKSANFKIEKKDDNTLSITTIGNGHGVGMSQWGANYLAKSGGNYEEILKYYYTGVQLSEINDSGS